MPINYIRLINDPDGYKYILQEDFVYKSRTFNRVKTLKAGMKSDGATGARDLGSIKITKWYQFEAVFALFSKLVSKLPRKKRTAGWYVHDAFCEDPFWDDGTPVTNFVASTCLSGILHTDGYWLESYCWWPATFFLGGEYIKKVNGWFWIGRKKNESA